MASLLLLAHMAIPGNGREVRIAQHDARRLGSLDARAGGLRLHRSHDVYNKPYAEAIDPAVEVGCAAWVCM